MINTSRLSAITEDLRTELLNQQRETRAAIEGLPEGDTKEKLGKLLSRAASGVPLADIQRELNKILKNAS